MSASAHRKEKREKKAPESGQQRDGSPSLTGGKNAKQARLAPGRKRVALMGLRTTPNPRRKGEKRGGRRGTFHREEDKGAITKIDQEKLGKDSISSPRKKG